MLIINIGWIVHFIAETNLCIFSLTWGEKSDHEKHFSLSSAWFAVGLSIFCQDRWIIGNAGMLLVWEKASMVIYNYILLDAWGKRKSQ